MSSRSTPQTVSGPAAYEIRGAGTPNHRCKLQAAPVSGWGRAKCIMDKVFMEKRFI
jgi:hypothetical protein